MNLKKIEHIVFATKRRMAIFLANSLSILLFFLFAPYSNCLGVTEDQSVANSATTLDHINIEINGILHSVKNKNEIRIVKGDELIIKNAMLSNNSWQVSNVNLVGYINPAAPRQAEDRGFKVDSAKDLMPSWSIDRKGGLYKISVSHNRTEQGEVYVRLIEPELKQALLNINGVTKSLKVGDLVRIKSQDKIKIENIVTNIENDPEDIQFQIVPVTNNDDKSTGPKLYEMRFIRKNKVFAWLPLQVEG